MSDLDMQPLLIELGTEGRDFADWLVDHLYEVHRNWLKSRN